jgi:alpha-tubulin suppressor-like RCC1 family protein
LSTRVPKRIESLNGISIEFVSCGEDFTCCVSEDRDLYVFGTNYSGCLGLGLDNEKKDELTNQIVNIFSPTLVPFFKNNNLKVNKISTGDMHVIVLTTNNRVFTWGCGEFGRLGKIILKWSKNNRI